MADKKISALNALAAASFDSADLLPIVDTSATETKKTTIGDLLSYFKKVTGTRSSPTLVTTASPITIDAVRDEDMYVAGNAAPATLTAAELPAASRDGKLLTMIGRSNSNKVTLTNAGLLVMNGDCVLGQDSVIILRFDGSAYVEVSRNDL